MAGRLRGLTRNEKLFIGFLSALTQVENNDKNEVVCA